MSRIGNKIRAMRTSHGVTQKQLAKATGVTEKFIDDVESGKRIAGDDLVKRICKHLGEEFSELMIYNISEPKTKPVSIKRPIKKEISRANTVNAANEVQEVWSDALDSVVKTIPIYNYDLSKATGTKRLPVISNKVEGYPKDKVFYLNIQDNDMLGFRMMKGDLAFACSDHEIINDCIYLVEYGGKRGIRQIKTLDKDKRVLLISNNGTLVTETLLLNDLKVLAKLIKLEIKL